MRLFPCQWTKVDLGQISNNCIAINNDLDNILLDSLKTLWPLFMNGVQLPKGKSLREGSLLFTTTFPDIPGTHFIHLRRMKDWVNLGATPMVLNTGLLHWKSSALTSTPLLIDSPEKIISTNFSVLCICGPHFLC